MDENHALRTENQSLRTQLAEEKAKLDHQLTANEPGTTQYWIQKHDELAVKFGELLVKVTEKEAEAAVLRSALQLAKEVTSNGFLPNPHTKRFDMTHFDVHTTIDKALSTTAGQSLLDQLEELKRDLMLMKEQCRVSDEGFNFHLKRANVYSDQLEEARVLLSEVGYLACDNVLHAGRDGQINKAAHNKAWLTRRNTLLEKMGGGKWMPLPKRPHKGVKV